jgi:uncharacterized damage-inducible protein DinB
MSSPALSRLYEHLGWADARVLEALRAAPDPARRRPLELFAHILGSEHVWLARMMATQPRLAVWPSLTLGDAERIAEENREVFRALLAGLGPDGLHRVVSYVNSAGASFENTMQDILIHVAMHGHYHRGQVALLLRDGGAEPPTTDYVAFIRGAPAARRAPPPTS